MVEVAGDPNAALRVELHAVHSCGSIGIARQRGAAPAWKGRIQCAIGLELGKPGDTLTSDLTEGASDQHRAIAQHLSRENRTNTRVARSGLIKRATLRIGDEWMAGN